MKPVGPGQAARRAAQITVRTPLGALVVSELGGYSGHGGPDTKQFLLALEGVDLS